MKRRHILIVALLVAALLAPARGGAFAETLATAGLSPLLTRPVVSPRSELLAQIGGVGSKKKPREEKEKEKEKVEQPVKSGGVDRRKAMLFSLLVPGLGQQISGRPERARVFYGIEAAIWTSFVAFRLQGDARKDRYIQFAEFNGGVVSDGKDNEYWRLIAQYQRSDPGPGSANEFVRRQARALYPDDREAQEAYFQDHGYFEDNAWDWQNADNLDRYRELRGRSLDSYNRAEFSIALALAHRIISVIDAARVAGGTKKAAPTETESGSLAPHGRFGVKLARDGDSRVPMLTYKLTF